jgi:transposase
MPRSKQTRRRSGALSTIHPHAAGIDIGATFHVVAVPPERDERPVRTFRTFSGDLHQLADWLTAVGITTVAMESTGVYWIPVFEILEARGFEVLLVNARNVKHVPGRKTDVNDAQWLQQLISMGCCGAAFVRARVSSVCAPIFVIESVWSTTPRPTFSTCRKPSCR